MGFEALALLIAKSLAPILVARLAGAALPQERVSRWLGRDPPRLALRAALREALDDVQSLHPDVTEQFFDDVFLASQPVAALLAQCVPPGPPPEPTELAKLYVDHLGPVRDHDAAVARARPVAADFLAALREHLRVKEPFRPLFDSVAADSSAASLKALLDALPDLVAR